MSEVGRWVGGFLLLACGAVLVGVPLLVSPRFSGSLTGTLFGIAGAILMVLSFSYIGLKHVRGKLIGFRRMSAKRLLQIHVAFGMAAAALALLHTGNALRSPMGLALILTLSGILVTGFIGRYQLRRISRRMRTNEEELLTLRKHISSNAANRSELASAAERTDPNLLSAIADIEVAQQIGAALDAAFRRWTIAHVLISLAMMAILGLHIGSAIYLGLRWWP